ncbi:DUF2535 family protein [Peribacillus asahii]|uniref:DUF2535 family protein n=2 Tax=Peribacillus asahii TaxID=228899 RepID=UPI0027D85C0E|nr:DUF2535 family protein [Peribacillus asahii]
MYGFRSAKLISSTFKYTIFYPFIYFVYNEDNRIKKRIDSLLLKSLEFKNYLGQKVMITDISVLLPDDPNYFMVHIRLKVFTEQVFKKNESIVIYSFKQYLATVLKWPVYRKLFAEDLINNA